MLVQRLRRWSNIKTTLGQFIMFAGDWDHWLSAHAASALDHGFKVVVHFV